MPSSDAKPRRKPFVWLAVLIVVAIAGYTAGWFYLADRLAKETDQAIAGLNHDSVVAECANPTVRGYPFRIGIYCDSLAYEDTGHGIVATAGSLRTAAQIYQPSANVAELDGPLRVAAPGLPPLWLDWDRLRASVRLAEPLPERLSIETEGLSGQTDPAGDEDEPVSLFSAERAEAHWRPNGTDFDWAATFAGLQMDPAAVGGRTLPVLGGTVDMTLTDGVRFVADGGRSLRGHAGTIRTLDLTTGPETGLALNGTFSVADDGMLDADLKVDMRDPKGVAAALAQAFPEAKDQLTGGLGGIAQLGSALPIRIRQGRAVLGFIPLGEVPPLP